MSFGDLLRQAPGFFGASFVAIGTLFGSLILLVAGFEVQLLLLKVSAFIAPPPARITNMLDLNPDGYSADLSHLHSNQWANLASVLTLFLLIVMLVLIHKKTIVPSVRVLSALAVLSIALWVSYALVFERLTVLYDGPHHQDAYGQRFVIGIEETDALKAYRQSDPDNPISSIIDDFPGAANRLWSPWSVTCSFVILGCLYVATCLAFASALIIAGEMLVSFLKGFYPDPGKQGIGAKVLEVQHSAS